MVYVLLIVLIVMAIAVYINYRNVEWDRKPLDNFPFKYRGKTYWYSRSVATILACFCKDSQGMWRVLVNKRGKGTPDFQGYWNLVCGYLQFNVSGQQNVLKELKEETGVEIPLSKVKFHSVETSPLANKQNVSLRYYAILDGVIDDYPTTAMYSEKDEVESIGWIRIDKLDEFKWAFEHDNLIKVIFESTCR